jgi:CRISPR/Cas system-associated endonuclease/helicase Cas3
MSAADWPDDGKPIPGVIFNNDHKYDLQLSTALIRERQLGRVFAYDKIEKVELKCESVAWEREGKVAIEFADNGRPSGLSTTHADQWCHELRRNDKTLLRMFVPIERMHQLAEMARKQGRYRLHCGDDDRMSIYLWPIWWFWVK